MSINGRMHKQHMVYLYSGILFSLKRKEFLSHATTMNLEDVMLSEISQSQITNTV